MKDRLAKIIEWSVQMEKLQKDKDVTLHENIGKWSDDVSFLLIELIERDERIRKLEKVIINNKISEM